MLVTERPGRLPTPSQKHVNADSTVNSPGAAPPRHISSVRSPTGLPARPTHARDQIIWLKDAPSSRIYT